MPFHTTSDELKSNEWILHPQFFSNAKQKYASDAKRGHGRPRGFTVIQNCKKDHLYTHTHTQRAVIHNIMTPVSACCLSVSRAGVLSDNIIITRLSYDIVTRRLSPPFLSIVTLNSLLAFVPCCCQIRAACVLDCSITERLKGTLQLCLNGPDFLSSG